MFSLNVKRSEPVKIDTKFGENHQREWLIPTKYRAQFFDYWRKNSFALRDKGFNVTKRENDWYLLETHPFLHNFKGFEDKKPIIKESTFFLPPREISLKDGLRTWQVDSAGKLCSALEQWSGAIDGSEMGVGKCHPAGTLIRMLDGSLKKVEDIVIGDKLMGDDSTVRNVLSTSRGYGDLFNIHPYTGGEAFGVNGEHILVLINTSTKEISEFSVREYIFKCTSSTRFHSEWKLFRNGVEYPKKDISVDAYFLGLWLGDGTWCRMEISVADIDTEIQQFLKDFSEDLGLRLVIGNPKKVNETKVAKCRPYNIRGKMCGTNPLLDKMRELGLTRNKIKFIPEHYLHNDRTTRINLLAGIIDSDGSSYCNGGYEVSCKNDSFCDQIVELSRSLGYCTTANKVDRTWTYKGKKYANKYWRISISGANDIPCKLRRKFSKPRLQPKNVLHTSFGVEPLGIGNYYGFTLDNNHRYLMKDFTVTHNTYTSIGVVRDLGVKFAVICPKAVISQWQDVIDNHFAIKNNCIGIVNYESLIRGKSDSPIASYIKNKKTHKEEFLWKLPKDAVIIWDEAHKLKNFKTKNSKTCMKAYKQGIKQMFLSASIATTPLELRTIGTCLQMFKGPKDYYQFLYDNGCTKGRWGFQFNNDKEVLKRIHKSLFSDRGVRLRRDEIPNFPEYETEISPYNLDDDSTKRINQIYDEMNMELKKIDKKIKKDCKNELTIRLRAREKTEMIKLPLILEMVNEAIEAGMSAVIFLNFSASIDALAERLNTKCIFDGRVGDKVREKNKQDFQNNTERVIIINSAAGGTGLSIGDLDGDHPRISIISPDDSAFKMKQVTGRTVRENSKSKSIIRFVYISGTIEEKVANNVKQKLDNLELLNDGDLKL